MSEPKEGCDWVAPDGRVFQWNPITEMWGCTLKGNPKHWLEVWKLPSKRWVCAHVSSEKGVSDNAAGAYNELAPLAQHIEDL